MTRPYDVVVLAGGAAHRLGGIPKPTLVVGGKRLLDHVLDGCAEAGRVAVVGPASPTSRDVRWCREDPPGGGPLAGLAAGVEHVDASVVVVLAADMPFVASAVPMLLAALGEADAAVLVDEDGIRQPLAGAYSRGALVRRLEALRPTAGKPVRALLQDVHVVEVRATREAFDCDTWDDVREAETRLAQPAETPPGPSSAAVGTVTAQTGDTFPRPPGRAHP